MKTLNQEIVSAPDREIVSTRIFNHNRALVFNAWANPDRLKNWWGPNGFTNTFHEFDLRPGGKWSFVMHGPDGTDYLNESIFVAIVEPELLVWNHLSAHKSQVAATFEEIQDSKTKVVFRMTFQSKEEYDQLKTFIGEKNEENFDRLEMELQRDDFFYT